MSEIFDLDAYFARVGYTGPRTATLATLEALHALHPAAIPFENLDPLLGRPVFLDLALLQAKLVGQRRGGYCFEQNSVFGAALDALGFAVTRLAGRVRWMAPPERPEGPRSHMFLQVDLEGSAYLADVGFGGHLFSSPIKLEPDTEQQAGANVLRLTGEGHRLTLQSQLPSGWQDIYQFTLDPQVEADFQMANWFTSTYPASLFRGNLLAERLTPNSRHSLFNRRLVIRHDSGGVDERVLANPQELANVLESSFHITPPASAADIWARIPRD